MEQRRGRRACLILLLYTAGALSLVPSSWPPASKAFRRRCTGRSSGHRAPSTGRAWATSNTRRSSLGAHGLRSRSRLSAATTRRRSRCTGPAGLRASVASWPTAEGGAANDGEEGDTRATVGSATVATSSIATTSGKSDQNPANAEGTDPKTVVLVEQEGPAWTEIVWDEGKGRFVEANSLLDRTKTQRVRGAVGGLRLLVRHWFVPEDVTPDYYHFTLWRMFQRFVAGTVNVFGTQALLLALGIKSRRLGAAAAMSWVLKDALGKFGRILWASKMGRRFDSDAKRWRFRSSLLYAAGNGLEIITYVFPASFLVLAAAANSFKQMSMLTSSATRNTIYRSFARGENIGDITAKGEAQIAVVDLLGILSGIGLCTLVGTSRHSILVAYIVLSMVDISAIYLEIRAVVFTVLNHERTHLLVRDYVSVGSDPGVMARTTAAERSARPKPPPSVPSDTVPTNGEGIGRRDTAPPTPQAGITASRGLGDETRIDGGAGGAVIASAAVVAKDTRSSGGDVAGTPLLSSPSTVSRRENIFLPSRLTTHVFKTWSKAGMDMDDVEDLLKIFGEERYMLAYTAGKPRHRWAGRRGTTMVKGGKGIASIILNKNATGADTVKSMLALEYFHDELARAGYAVGGGRTRQVVVNGSRDVGPLTTAIATDGVEKGRENGGFEKRGQRAHPSAAETRRFMEAARRRANEGAPGFLDALESLGWSTEKFMFGNIRSRVEWRGA